MKINFTRIIILILPIIWFVSCSSANIKEREISSEVRNGRSLLESADHFLKVNDLNTALQTYETAYKLFTLVDDIEGKFQASIGIIKTLTHLCKYDDALSMIKKIENTEITSTELTEQYKLTLVEYHFSKKEYDPVINLTDLKVINNYSGNLPLIMLAYRLYSLLKLNQDYANEKNILIESIQNIQEKESALTEKDLFDLGFVYFTLGYIFSKDEKWEKAHSFFLQSLEIEKQDGNHKGIADNLYALGIVSKKLGKFKSAIDYFQRASDVYNIMKDNSSAEKSEVERLMIKLQLDKNDNESLNNLRKILYSTNDEELRNKIRNLIRE